MRAPLLTAVLCLLGALAAEDGCSFPEGPTVVKDTELSLHMQVSSHGRPPSLFLNWEVPVPEGLGYTLRLTRLGTHSSPEEWQGRAGPNATGFEFHDLPPGARFQLETTVVLPCGRNATHSVMAQTTPMPVSLLRLHRPGDPAALEATWGSAPGEQDRYQLLLYHLDSQTLARNLSVPPGTLSFLFDGLLPGSEYALRVTTWAGELHASTGVRQWTDPVPPEHLALHHGGSSTALQASWSGAEGATWMHLILTDLMGGANHSAVAKRGVSNYTFNHLTPGTPYHLEVRATSGPLTASGPNATEWTYPSVPLDLVPTSQPPGLSLSWQAGPGRREGYQLYLRGQAECNISLGPGALNATFPGPLPTGHYTLELVALAGPQRASAWTDIWLEAPAAPSNLSLSSKERPPVLRASWGPPSGDSDGYRLRLYQLAPPRLEAELTLGPATRSFSWARLPLGTEFMVQLAVLRGPEEGVAANTTGWTYPEAPENLTLTNVGSPEAPALQALWRMGRAQSYALTLSQLPQGTVVHHLILPGNATEHNFRGLEPGTEYGLRAWAVAGAYRAWAHNITHWTPPLPPVALNVSSEGPTSLQVSWGQAPGGRGSYHITLHREGVVVDTQEVGPEVVIANFLGLTPGTKYEVEVSSQAGPHRVAAANITTWTSPLAPEELSVAMQGDSAVVSLGWAETSGQGDCQAWFSEPGGSPQREPLQPGQANLVLRGLTPGRNVSLSVLCQAGPLWATTGPVVLPVEPGPVEDVQCQPGATCLTLNWTVPTGDVDTCLVAAEQLVTGEAEVPVFYANTSQAALLLSDLVPATSYRLSLTILGRNGLWSRTVTLLCTTTTEAWQPPKLAAAPRLEPEAGAGVVITPGMFGEEDRHIQFYGIVATTNTTLLRPHREAISHTWYDHYYGGQDSYLALLLPNPFRPGPRAALRSWTVPVGTEDCGQTKHTCNGRLKPDIQYRFSVAAFTRYDHLDPDVSFTAFSEPRASSSVASVPLPVAAGVVAGCVLTVGAVLGLLYWRQMSGQRAEKRNLTQEMATLNLRHIHRPIPIQSFRQTYDAKSASAHYAFFQEFEELKEVGKEQPKLEAELPANTAKNRYPHVLPYDHSRVRLSRLEDEPNSDYINANFIPGYTRPQEFIATQGPLKKTLEDFWRLVWEQQVNTVVMLTVGMENGRVLCEHYWPSDAATPALFGHITIRLLAEVTGEEWTTREFQLFYGPQQRERQVQQLQYTAWPDHGLPESTGSIMAFVELVRERGRVAAGAGPTLVHCSTGVGRTGTFIALARLLQQLEEEKTVDVFNTVYTLRLHRYLMIQTLAQYIFLHSCLLDKISEEPQAKLAVSQISPGPIAAKSFLQQFAKKSASANAGFLREYENLLEALKHHSDPGTPCPGHQPSNPISQLLPYDRSRVQFSRLEQGPLSELGQAWLFPGGALGQDCLALAGPVQADEFWRLVWEHDVRVLISLCPPESQDQEEWYPLEGRPIHTEALTVRWEAEVAVVEWPCSRLWIKHEKKGKERQLWRFQFLHWESGREPPAHALPHFLEAVLQCSLQDKKPGTLLAHASSGLAQLGTLLALELLLHQAGKDGTVDVFSVVLRLAQGCRSMTPTLAQYMYLYSCVHSALTGQPV
ncbi:receptor-type tyrosine-protein phosphatase V-like isoform X1 [Tachyglossus aculeatus]|uniref:receptor-type tyrosine-protein phosphatase V-like isoform X1 n=1 Tax=Tachyglossus aculeatus TaxID=9261 RepID=UPI0018F45EB2|nr:receptor-type tyrosine-protein phosphatase V-like isoform X1 [Tachyglossus aculeatus]